MREIVSKVQGKTSLGSLLGDCEGKWIGVDLDSTLAKSQKEWRGYGCIGAPIMPAVRLVRRLLDAGYEVRIFTARAACKNPVTLIQAKYAITAWCIEHIGVPLPVTCEKDSRCARIIDDRVIEMRKDKGYLRRVESEMYRETVEMLIRECERKGDLGKRLKDAVAVAKSVLERYR